MRKFLVFMFVSILSILFLSSCGLGENEGSSNSVRGDDWANIPIQDSGSISHEVVPDESNDLWNKTEYDAPTGKWFLHNGAGVFGYGFPSGTYRPGDSFSVKLFSHAEDGDEVNRIFRITLSERTDDLQFVETVFEEEVYVEHVKGDEEIYSSSFPEKENVIYLLSVQVINDEDEVEDTLLSLVKVPKEELNATLFTDKEEYEAEDKELTLTVKNDGPTDLVFGVYYTLEKKVGETWEEVILELAFIDIAIILPAGKEYEQTINIEELDAGEYRIFKDVHAEGVDLQEKLMTQFTVK